MKTLLIFLILLKRINSLPLNSTNTTGELQENLAKFNYSIIDKENEIFDKNEDIDFKSYNNGDRGGYEANLDDTDSGTTTNTITTTITETTTTIEILNSTTANSENLRENDGINPIFDNSFNDTENRPVRQDDEDQTSNEFEEEEDDEEEDTNMVTGLISAFLGGLSRPDGSIDVEAITGLLGSLSMQNDDGSYDFTGLTDLLRSFFGGGGDEGGGSDFGAFIGGLLGAFLKGITNPPGPKGAGIFTGKIVTGLLPALSVSPDSDDSQMPPQLDSGSFLGGLLKTVLGGSSGGGTMTNTTYNNQGGGSKFPLFKAIFSLITSVFTSSSNSH